MHRFQTRLAITFLGVLVCLAACSSTATVSLPTATASPMATWLPPTPPPNPTLTPTLAPPTFAPVPLPTNVPPGWKVLEGFHFSLAYPPDWSVETSVFSPGVFTFTVESAIPSPLGVSIQAFVVSQSVGSDGMAPYCFGAGQVGVGRVLLAGLSVAYLSGQGEGANLRSWAYVNAQRTEYLLGTGDSQDTAAVQAQNNSVLATFRPDNAIPWTC